MQFRSGLVRPRGTRLTVSLVVAAVAILLMTALPAEAATASPYNTNLVKNPGAEQGGASSDGQS